MVRMVKHISVYICTTQKSAGQIQSKLPIGLGLNLVPIHPPDFPLLIAKSPGTKLRVKSPGENYQDEEHEWYT